MFHQMGSPQLTISGSPGIPLVNQQMKFVALSKGLSSQHGYPSSTQIHPRKPLVFDDFDLA